MNENVKRKCKIFVGQIIDIVLSWISRRRALLEQQQEQLKQAQAWQCKMTIAVHVQHDVAFIISGMTIPWQLTPVHDLRNLAFVDEKSLAQNIFVFCWRKYRNYLLTDQELDFLKNELNRQIQHVPSYLNFKGYTNEQMCSEFPILCAGMSIANIVQAKECVYLYVRANI